MSARILGLDWSHWSPSLRTTIEIMLGSRYAMWLGWGDELTFYCNDAYQPTLGVKQSWALGRPAREVWAEIWPEIGPRIAQVMATDQATWDEGLRLVLERSGFAEETYHTFSYSPVPDGQGGVGGMLCVVTEETERILSERRLAFLHATASALAEARTEPDLFQALERCCRQQLPPDLPYLRVGESQYGVLPEKTVKLPVADLPVWAGLNSLRPYDDSYQNFLSLFAGQVSAALGNVRAYELERQRAEALAEIDRAKTRFFSNISHEFRTPLTLILGPLEEMLGRGDPQIEIIHRNALRLLKLVNTLLEFSRLESGRPVTSPQPTDLSALTQEIAELFRPMVESAGLQFQVDCPPLGQNVQVDRDMWERVVLNLLSNAFKFTLKGQISVRLQRRGQTALLMVQDSGCGIPEDQLANVFQRFHRVEGSQGRTYEGSGIGLALSLELLQLHGGSLEVASAAGQGSIFTASLPMGEVLQPAADLVASPLRQGMLSEAGNWAAPEGAPVLQGPRILLADDNADMRRYVESLLHGHYQVESVNDGLQALEAIRRERPALLLSDVMMPGLDGLQLLREIRQDPRTASLPVIFISARAGEEAKLEGFEEGADDYLIKPFAARELLARVAGQLRRSRLRESMDQALSAASMVTYEWELDSDRLVVSATAREVMGWTAAELETTGQKFRSIHPDDRARHLGLVEAAVAQEGNFSDQIRWLRPDTGAEVWLEVRGTATRTAEGSLVVSGVAVDITRQKLTQQALQDSQANFEQLLEQAPEPVFLASPEGIYTEANRLACELLDERLEDLIGTRVSERVHPDDWPRLEGFFTSLRQHQTATGEWILRRRDGSFVLTDLTVGVLPDGRLLCFARDITHRRQLLDAERSARSEAERLNRMKDEFLATLSHELRTPLNAITGWAEILCQGGLEPEDVAQGLEVISRNSRSLAQMIQDLLDTSRVVSGKVQLEVQALDLVDVVSKAVESVVPTAQAKGVELTRCFQQGPLTMAGDPDRLQQVVWNLLSNAIRYTPAGGHIEVSVKTQGNQLQVSVQDSGEGIEADFLPYVFERFRQADASTSRRYGGLGLGLNIVKQLVELHGGSVSACSEGPGKGSIFQLLLPVHSSYSSSHDPAVSSSGAPENPGLPSIPRLQGELILVVDDDKDARELAGRILRDHGAQVALAASVREALGCLVEREPRLLVSDIGLPEQDGYDLIRQVRQLDSPLGALPAIALTAFAREQDRQRVLEAGYQAYLTKPVNARQLLSQCVVFLCDGSP